MSSALYAGGVDALLALPMQQLPVSSQLPFDRLQPNPGNLPESGVAVPLLVPPASPYGDQVDFTGPYGNYFFELFFHAPILVAKMLHDNQQFLAAEKWYQFIFNPTLPPDPLTSTRFAQLLPEDIVSSDRGTIYKGLITGGWIDVDGAVTEAALTATVPEIKNCTNTSCSQAEELKNLLLNRYLATPTARYWQFQPFRNHTIESLKDQLQNNAEIAAYNDDPFDPHAVARLRIGAYEKATVMAYIGNLLDWGDQQFSEYTWESITTARMLYTYAYDLLGQRPEDLGPCEDRFPTTFNDILARYGDDPHNIPQFLIDMENALCGGQARGPMLRTAGQPFNDLGGVFCVPENAQLVALWDRVEDRLYKIHNCLNILGQAQPLPLFDPPINPADLVRAAAAEGAFTSLDSPLQPIIPNYRFNVIVERAEDVTEAVRSFGAALLSALERRDSEGLGLLRATQEISILNLVTSTKQQGLIDLEDQLASLQQGLSSAQHRADYYSNLISTGLNAAETETLVLMGTSLGAKILALPIHGSSIGGYLTPNIFGLADGGIQLGEAINAGASFCSTLSELFGQSAAIAQTVGQNQRRTEEWTLEKQLAQYEVAALNHQIAATNARIASARQDLAINRQEIDHSAQVQSVLRTNFTNQQLYQWMAGRISTVYFQAFRLAKELALTAQTAYQFELDRDDQFITFAAWDDLRQGLLAGDGLLLGLKQMRKRYLDNDSRGFEIEKTISLRQAFPLAFFGFKWGHERGDQSAGIGQLDFTLAESLFDFDYPSHYDRKIKSIAVSVPSVIGPYQDLHATLTQNSNWVVLRPDPKAVCYVIDRTSARTSAADGKCPVAPAGTVRENWRPNQSIAVSRGIDDSGLFTLDFRDERYLPFEGTGAVSSWTFSMPPETNRIGFENISDIILTVRYTAREGGAGFGSKVKGLYNGSDGYPYLNAAVFNLGRSFSTQWAALFATPPDKSGQQTLTFPISRGAILPNLSCVKLQGILLQMDLALADSHGVSSGSGITLQIGSNKALTIPITNNIGELKSTCLHGIKGFTDLSWSLAFKLIDSGLSNLCSDNKLDPAKLLDIALIVVYSAKPFASS